MDLHEINRLVILSEAKDLFVAQTMTPEFHIAEALKSLSQR
jgi:hypothetical protein